MCFCHLHALSVVCWQCFPWRPHKLKYWFSHSSGSRSNTAKPWFLSLSKTQLLWESCHQISTTTIYFLFLFCYILASPDISFFDPSTLSLYIPRLVFILSCLTSLDSITFNFLHLLSSLMIWKNMQPWIDEYWTNNKCLITFNNIQKVN